MKYRSNNASPYLHDESIIGSQTFSAIFGPFFVKITIPIVSHAVQRREANTPTKNSENKK